MKEGVDTLLMYLYRALNCVDEMEKLASAENSCVVVCITAPVTFPSFKSCFSFYLLKVGIYLLPYHTEKRKYSCKTFTSQLAYIITL